MISPISTLQMKYYAQAWLSVGVNSAQVTPGLLVFVFGYKNRKSALSLTSVGQNCS